MICLLIFFYYTFSSDGAKASRTTSLVGSRNDGSLTAGTVGSQPDEIEAVRWVAQGSPDGVA